MKTESSSSTKHFFALVGMEDRVKMFIEVVKHTDSEHVYVRLPYALVETGGRVTKALKDGDLHGPYVPGKYLLLSVGMVDRGPLLRRGISARQILEPKKSGDLCLWVVGKTLPPKNIQVSKVLEVLQKLIVWAEDAKNGKWKDKIKEAHAAARTLELDGVEIIEYSSYEEWENRLKSS